MKTTFNYTYESDDLKPIAIELFKRLGKVDSIEIRKTAYIGSGGKGVDNPDLSAFSEFEVINQVIFILDETTGIVIGCDEEYKDIEIRLYGPLLQEHNAKTMAAFAAFQQIVGAAKTAA